jgi:HemK-related putative methylase
MKIERCQGVYEPEDDSYLLMEIEEVRGKIIEIGCGTGIVGLSYAEAGANVTLVDTSEKAVKCASRNATINRISANVVRTDMFGGIKGKFDYCLFNPPYLPSEPPDDPSWTGGIRGDEITIEFLQNFKNFSKCAFYIESSLSPITKRMFKGLAFQVVKKIEYEIEVLSLMKVSVNALHR